MIILYDMIAPLGMLESSCMENNYVVFVSDLWCKLKLIYLNVLFLGLGAFVYVINSFQICEYIEYTLILQC